MGARPIDRWSFAISLRFTIFSSMTTTVGSSQEVRLIRDYFITGELAGEGGFDGGQLVL